MIDRQDTGVARAVREALHHPVCAAMALALAAGAPVTVNAAGNITLSGGPLPYLGPTNLAPDLDYILIEAGATVNGNVTNAPNAAVTGAVTPVTGYAVSILDSTLNGALINRGLLGSVNLSETAVALSNSTLTGGIQNSGTIQSQYDGIDVGNGSRASGGILNSGTIAVGGIGIWIDSATVSGGIENRGTIRAQTDGIDVLYGASVTGGILNSGTIAADLTGIWLEQATLTAGITNSGTIIGNTGDGIALYSAAVNGPITNSGLIDAPQGVGIRVAADLRGGIVNTGIIRGGVAAIDTRAATGPTVINLNGGAIDGNINLSPTFADTVNATAGTMTGNIVATGPADDRVNFILNAGVFTFNGNISGVNLVFVDPGTLYLNGNVSGVNTVNLAANTTLVLGTTATVNTVNFIQDPTATLTFAQAANGSHGLINGSNVNLAGNLALPNTGVNGLFAPNYTLDYGTLMTWTTRSGTFNSLTTGSIFLNGTLNYWPTTLTAQVTRLPFTAVPPALRGNSSAVATGLENAYPAAYTRMDADAITFYAPIFGYSVGHYTQFLEAVSGSSYANALQLSLFNAQLLNTAVDQRLGGTGGPLGVTNLDQDRAPTAAGARALWATVLGNWGNGSGDSQAPGFNQGVGGIALGADYRLTARTLVGLLAGYQSGRISFDNHSSTDTTSWQLGTYGQYEANRWYGNGLLTFGWNGYDSQRNILLSNTGVLAKGHYQGTALVLYGEGGYQLPLGPATIKPMLGLGYVRGDTGSFTESAGGVYRLHVQGAAGDSFTSNLGVRAELAYRTASGTWITGEARAIWQHEFLADHQSIDASFAALPGSNFRVVGSRFASDSAILGLGVKAQVAAHTEIALDYDTRLDNDYTANTLFAAVRIDW